MPSPCLSRLPPIPLITPLRSVLLSPRTVSRTPLESLRSIVPPMVRSPIMASIARAPPLPTKLMLRVCPMAMALSLRITASSLNEKKPVPIMS